MDDCPVCQLVRSQSLTLFEDEHVVAMVAADPMAPGHIMVVPKPHAPILESIPDVIIRRMFVVANKLSIAVFEAVGAQGTNFLVQNGIPAGQSKPHCAIHIIPRVEGDGLNLEWQPGNVSEDEAGKAELLLKEASPGIGRIEKEKPKPLEEKKPDEIEVSDSDYRIRQLKRIP